MCIPLILYLLKSYLLIILSDPAVQALQYLDGIHSKDPKEKAQFFRTTLTDVFPLIPKVSFMALIIKRRIVTFYKYKDLHGYIILLIFRNCGSNTCGQF